MDINQLLKQVQQESKERRKVHPDWPSHKSAAYFPDRQVKVCESMPRYKIEHCRAYCKYCYRTHGNWWMMDQHDYQIDAEDPIILCGDCEHTSLAGYAGLGRRHWNDK